MVDPTHCSHCGITISPGTTGCPNCGAVPQEKKPQPNVVARVMGWRHFRHVLIVAILLLLPHLPPTFWNALPFRLLLRTSPLVLEAVIRANEHPDAEALLGRPVNPGWLSRGYVLKDETGWSEGKIWIPASGVRADGMLYARGGRTDEGPWVFSELRLVRDDGRTLDLLAPIPQPSLVPLKNDVKIFIVPFGQVQGLGLETLPEFYRERYGLSVRVVEPVPLEPRTFNPERGQRISEELVQLMRRRLPHLARDKSAFLIGVTDEDVYIRDPQPWNFAYTAYHPYYRAGIVSSHRFVPYPLERNEKLLRARVRKMVTRTIGFVVLELPRSDDPSSVMFRDLYSWASTRLGRNLTSADLMSDSLEGLGARAVVDEFFTAHGMSPSRSELLSGVENFDYSKVDGRYPCVRLTRSNRGSITAFNASVGKCEQEAYLNKEVDEIEADLRDGSLITRNTDLFISGATPVAVTRCYRSWDNLSRSFGRNAALSWDLFPFGSRQPYTYIVILTCDGLELRYQRISKGTGYADAIYEHRETATPFLASRFSWNGNGWDLKLRDGSLLLFPESYYAKKPIDGALTGFRDAHNQTVKVERRERQNLQRLTTPERHFIAFEHDPSNRIVNASDDQHRKVEYFYDHGGRLVEVRGFQSTRRLSYTNTYLREIEENGQRLAEFGYEDQGRISRLSLPGGPTYRIRYDFDGPDKKRIIRAVVTSPDGSIAKLDIPRN